MKTTNDFEQWVADLKEKTGSYSGWFPPNNDELLYLSLSRYGFEPDRKSIHQGSYTSHFGVQIIISREDNGEWILSVIPCRKKGVLPIAAFPPICTNYHNTVLLERITHAQEIIKSSNPAKIVIP